MVAAVAVTAVELVAVAVAFVVGSSGDVLVMSLFLLRPLFRTKFMNRNVTSQLQ